MTAAPTLSGEVGKLIGVLDDSIGDSMNYIRPVGVVNLALVGAYTPPVGTVNLNIGAISEPVTFKLFWAFNVNIVLY